MAQCSDMVRSAVSKCVAFVCLLACSACAPKPPELPEIVFDEVPLASVGGATRLDRIRGHVRNAKPGQRVVLYARSGLWWVQPFSNRTFTEIQPDGTFHNETHLGFEYAALLVDANYEPLKKAETLPDKTQGISAVVRSKGRGEVPPEGLQPAAVTFSGYDWDIKQVPSDSAGVMFENSAKNVWLDSTGALHLRTARQGQTWTCAEVQLQRSLGYGTYSFTLRDLPDYEPSTLLALFTWDDREAGQNHRELDIELSQWGDPQAKDAQFVVQPYYVAANSFRFRKPKGTQTHRFRWEPGRVIFESLEGRNGKLIARQEFSSGVPVPGGETVHAKLNIYGKSRTKQENPVEVILEKFEFLP